MRLDIEVVNRKLFESRNKAQTEIKSGNVYVNGKKITQCSAEINENDLIVLKDNTLNYVSKGGLKLEKIIKKARLNLHEKIVIDIGASTGGFTDCAIQNGAKKVYAIDVGTNQLHKSLKNNDKVTCYENTDFREINNDKIFDGTMATIDISFISSLKIIDKIKELSNLQEIILLIKPQFECGKEYADKYKGVVLNRDIHFNVIKKIIKEYQKNGYFCNCLTFSPITGGKGNIEYIAYFSKFNNKNFTDIYIRDVIKESFNKFQKNYHRKK